MTKRKVVVNFSGGKDSTAAIIEALKVYPRGDIILCFQDTGLEYLETLGHVKLIADMLDLPLHVIGREGGFWDMVEHRRHFPGPTCRVCTARLKRAPLNKWLTQNFKGKGYEVIVVSGIRADESLIRSRRHEWENPQEHWLVKSASKLWFPCIDKSAKEVKQLVRAEGLPLHPCYDFAARCGCWCCFFAPKSTVRIYAEEHPDLIKHAIEVEKRIKHKWKENLSLEDLMRQPRLL